MSKLVVPEEILTKYITHDNSADGVDRRGFLQCMAWTGTGVLWALKGMLQDVKLWVDWSKP